MTVEASMTASAVASVIAGSSFARPAMESVTAVEETSPPTRPVRPSPRRAPSSRIPAYPTNEMPEIRTTRMPT